MKARSYQAAAWLSFTSVALGVPLVVTTFMYDTGQVSNVLPLIALLNLLSAGLTIYLGLKLLSLLRHRYDYRALEIPIYTNLVLYVIAVFTGVLMRFLGFADPVFSLLILALPLAPASIAGIVAGARLLKLPGELRGLKTPLGVLMITSWALSLTLFLIPLGLLAGLAETVVLGIVFLRADADRIPEFV